MTSVNLLGYRTEQRCTARCPQRSRQAPPPTQILSTWKVPYRYWPGRSCATALYVSSSSVIREAGAMNRSPPKWKRSQELNAAACAAYRGSRSERLSCSIEAVIYIMGVIQLRTSAQFWIFRLWHESHLSSVSPFLTLPLPPFRYRCLARCNTTSCTLLRLKRIFLFGLATAVLGRVTQSADAPTGLTAETRYMCLRNAVATSKAYSVTPLSRDK